MPRSIRSLVSSSRVVPSLAVAVLAGLLTLGLPGCSKPASTPTAAAPEVSDQDLSTQVKTALLNDAQLKAFDITVVTMKGDVRLTGVVATAAQREQALLLARGVPGVHSLHDELTIKP